MSKTKSSWRVNWPRPRSVLRWILYMVVLACSYLIVQRLFHAQPSSNCADHVEFKDMDLVVHFPKDNVIIHDPNGVAGDLCPILGDCFSSPGSIFTTRPKCLSSLESIGKHFTSIVLKQPTWAFKDAGLPIGFISLHHEKDPDDKRRVCIQTYNLCILKEHRGRNLGPQLVQRAIELLIDKEGLDRRHVLLSLDIYMYSPTAAEAFASYVRMGYLRAWQPCKSVGTVDWRPLFYERDGLYSRNSQRSTTPSFVQSTLPVLMERTEEFVQKYIEPSALELISDGLVLPQRTRRDANTVLDHFCMFKFYDDSPKSAMKTLISAIERVHGPAPIEREEDED